jgi:hypothetical protein
VPHQVNVYRQGWVHILSEPCETCIFKPGNLMDLNSGRVKGMVEECLEHDRFIPCHQTMSYYHGPAAGRGAVCAGYWTSYHGRNWLLRMAVALDRIKFVTIEELEREG